MLMLNHLFLTLYLYIYSSCNVHNIILFLAQAHDPLRIDLKIPPDQYIYIKAATPAERQKWLVALGSSKACLTQGNTPQKPKIKNHGIYDVV